MGLIKAILLEERFKKIEYKKFLDERATEFETNRVANTEAEAEQWLERNSALHVSQPTHKHTHTHIFVFICEVVVKLQG